MSGTPDDPSDEEPTVVLPLDGAKPATPTPTPQPATSPWPDDDERTRIFNLNDEERTQIIGAPPPASPSPANPPAPPAAAAAVWDQVAAAPVGGDLVPGTVLGNYRVGEMIGRGGLGAIYTGVNIHNPAERVAIKTILPDPAAGERFGKMLLDEANALMRVRHEAVVPYRTYGRISENGAYYLVLEFIDGETLDDFYRRRKLTLKETFALGRRLAAGLEAAHQEGLVHRDISPDNVLLPQSQLDRATLIDFGIAKVGDEDLPDHQFAGKLSYAAPEQFVPGARIGPFTDVYSLALLLAAAARGENLPMGRTVGAAQEARRTIPALPDVPAPLAGPLQRMLEPHPPDRPQTMSAVIALLDEAERVAARAAAPGPAAVPAAAKPIAKPTAGVRRTERPAAERKPGRRMGGLISVLLALLIGGGAAGALMYFEDDIFGKPKGGATTTTAGTTPPGTTTTAGDTTGATPPPPGTDHPLPPPPPPPPQKSRADQLAEIVATAQPMLAAAPCAVTTLKGSDETIFFRLSIAGAWADQAAIARLGDEIAKKTGATVNVAGKTFDPALCPVAEQLKPLAAGFSGDRFGPSQRRPAPDRSTIVHLQPAGTAAAYYLVEADKAGQIAAVFDLSTAQSRSTVPGLTTLANGSYEIVLTPAALDANVDPSLLVAVSSATALSNAPTSGAFGAWVAAVSGAAVSIDVATRDGVPAGSVQIETPPPPPPPPPGDTPEQLVAKAKTAIEAKLATVGCSLTRVTAAPDGKTPAFTVNGVWGDEAALRSAAGDAASAAKATVDVAGDSVDAALCPALDGIKTASPTLGGAVLAQPLPPVAPDRTTTITITPRADASAVYLLEADRSGVVTGLIDLSSPEAIVRAKASGTLEDAGAGALTVRLKPASPTANVEATLIVAMSSATPLPAAAVAEKAMPLADWAAEAAKANAAIDVVERRGVAPAAPPPPPPPPPGGDITAEIRDSFAAVECSFITLVPPAGLPKEAGVTGLWGKASAVQAAADAATTAAGFPFVLKGTAVASRHCAVLNALKPYYVTGAAVSVTAPTPTGKPDRTSEARLTVDPAFAHAYVMLIDGTGQVRSLIELTDSAKLAQRIAQGMVIDDGSGRYRLVLPPYSKAADSPSQLLVTVMTTDPLPPEAFGFGGVVALKTWTAALTAVASATKLRVDAAEYVQAPP